MDRTKSHKLIDIIVITILSVICGADTWVDIETFGKEKEEWLKELLELPNGIPSHDTFGRVFSLLDSKKFHSCFLSWVKSVNVESKGKIVAIDGKSIRRSHKKNEKPLHLISAFATANGVTLGQRKVDGKSNEIAAIPELLETLKIKGCIITADAMATQGWIVKKIRQHKANYVLVVKGNQRRLQEDIAGTFNKKEKKLEGVDYYHSSETTRGREDVRECWVTNNLGNIRDIEKWVDLKSIACIKHTRYLNEKKSVEMRYYITSIKASSKKMVSIVREHWAIENKLHWMLDVGFNEDSSRIRIGYAQENLALVRKIALHLLKSDKTTNRGIKAKRFKAALNLNYLHKIIGI